MGRFGRALALILVAAGCGSVSSQTPDASGAAGAGGSAATGHGGSGGSGGSTSTGRGGAGGSAGSGVGGTGTGGSAGGGVGGTGTGGSAGSGVGGTGTGGSAGGGVGGIGGTGTGGSAGGTGGGGGTGGSAGLGGTFVVGGSGGSGGTGGAPAVTLNVSKAGTGTGTVTSSPTGINCGVDCTEAFASGTAVTLTATADPTTSDFTGWSGDCTGTGACVVTINAARNVTANFTLKTRTLTVARTGDGTGSVTVNPGAAVCSNATCMYQFPHGTSLSLTATPAGGSTFDGWSGGSCSGTGGCTFAITADTGVTATFNKASRNLNITFAGAASGSVLVNPGATTVNASGTLVLATHSAVTLAATPAANMGFAGWGGACASAGFGNCSLTLDADATVTVQFDPPNKAFVTSVTIVPGTLGGVNGGDTICAQRATAAGLTGTFKAFLGSTGATAWTRISSARGWARTGDGKPFGDQVSDLMVGRTYYPLVNTESGTEIPNGTLVATGTTGANTCGDWASTDVSLMASFGEPHSGYVTFANNGSTNCTSTTLRLYCFETTRSVMLRPPVPASARYAFLSAGGITGTTGFSAADTMCQNEATTANRAGTWRALLAGNGATAASRLSSTGAAWFRTDNVQLSATPADLLGGAMPLWAAMSLRADGLTQEQALTFTGAATVATAGSAAGSCTGWTSTTSTSAAMTYGNRMGTDWFGPFTSGLCSDFHRVFCFQQ